MKRFVFFSVVFFCSSLLFSQTTEDIAAIQAINWQEKDIQAGIKLKKCENVMIFNNRQSISIVEIDTALANVDFKIDYASAGFHPVSVFGQRNKAIAAINGTYFMTTGSSMYTPWHFIKIDGQKVSSTVLNEFSTRATGVFTVTGGNVDLSTWNRQKEANEAGDSEYALVCGPLLLDDGEECEFWQPDEGNTSGQNFIGINPRSCVATTNTGKVLLIAVDGRQNNRAVGMTMAELQFFVKHLGCTDAMNLDGGGSTALFVNGESNNGIVNIPIDSNVPGKERNVGNILYITPRNGSKPFCVTEIVPGGLASKNLRLWIKADGDITANANNVLSAPYVFDYTGYNSFSHYKANENAKILLNENTINFNPTLKFDSASALISSRKVDYTTFFSVNTLNNRGMLIGFDETGSAYRKPREFLLTASGRVYVHDGSDSNGYVSIVYNQAFNNTFNIFETSFGQTKDNFILNGKEQWTRVTDYNTRDKISAIAHIGARNTYPSHIPGRIDYFYDGDVAEIIAFTDTLTRSERNRVESYLAVKYGITMEEPTFVYESSTGVKWWNGASSSYSPFSNYITFIGRDDASGLNKMKSKGQGNYVLPESGSLLTLTHIGSAFGNLYYLIAGTTDDNTSLVEEVSSYRVMKRHWKFNCSLANSLTTKIEIDIPNGVTINQQYAGVLFKKGTSYTYLQGSLNSDNTLLTVSSASIPKTSEMYLVLNKITNETGVTEIEISPVNDVKIKYDQAIGLLSYNNKNGTGYVLKLYSTTGQILKENSNSIYTSDLSSGTFIVVLTDSKGNIIDRKKILIQNK